MLIQLEKKYVVLLTALVAGLVVVSAFGTNNPSVFGHSSEELANGTMFGKFRFNDTIQSMPEGAAVKIVQINGSGISFNHSSVPGGINIIWQNGSSAGSGELILGGLGAGFPSNLPDRIQLQSRYTLVNGLNSRDSKLVFGINAPTGGMNWTLEEFGSDLGNSGFRLTNKNDSGAEYVALQFNGTAHTMGIGGAQHLLFNVTVNGTANVSSTLTVGSLYSGAATGKVVCVRTDGSLGICTTAPAGTGECTCA